MGNENSTTEKHPTKKEQQFNDINNNLDAINENDVLDNDKKFEEQKHESITKTYKKPLTTGMNTLNKSNQTILKNNILSRLQFIPSKLVIKYPANFYHSHKKLIYNNIKKLQKNKSIIDSSKISYLTRWKQISLNNYNNIKSITNHIYKENVFKYNNNENNNNTLSWYLNFAHSDLFVAYRGQLLAQDELQVLEHPYLGSIRECLIYNKQDIINDIKLFTRINKQPTPILITNVPRQCIIDTLPDMKIQGREKGLYGNAFAKCKNFQIIETAVKYINPITYSNIICMEAPSSGYGKYKLNEIDYIFNCALTGFIAAKIETQIVLNNKNSKIIIHTGNWGCGAYGGNRILISLLQMLAADFSGVDQLVYHTFSKEFTNGYLKAKEIREKFIDENGCLEDWLEIKQQILDMGFQWGVSDGN